MEVSFILDTDVVSETSKSRPHPSVVEFVMTAPNILLCGATLMELQRGITEICARDPIKAVKLSRWYHDLTDGRIPIIASDREVMEAWGTLGADPRLRNLMTSRPDAKKTRSGQDLHLAAAALVHRAAIATFNVRDFLLINSCYPLPGIYDPKNEIWHAVMEPLDFGRAANSVEIRVISKPQAVR
jgi:predicted nucleic acid-binding protein